MVQPPWKQVFGSYKVKCTPAMRPWNSHSLYLSQIDENICPFRYLYMNVSNSLFHNGKKNWKSKCPFAGQWINRFLYIYTAEYFLCDTKEQTNDVYQNYGWISKILCWLKNQEKNVQWLWFHLCNSILENANEYIIAEIRSGVSWE